VRAADILEGIIDADEDVLYSIYSGSDNGCTARNLSIEENRDTIAGFAEGINRSNAAGYTADSHLAAGRDDNLNAPIAGSRIIIDVGQERTGVGQPHCGQPPRFEAVHLLE